MAPQTQPNLAIQAMDLTTLRAVLAELRPLLVPARFEKAQQPSPHTLQLGLRGLSGMRWLEISWLAAAPRLMAIDPPPKQGDGSTLARVLQHGLGGLALVAIEQAGFERVVDLHFAPRPGEPSGRRLVVELMGRHSNVFLLDAQGRVVSLARQVREQQSRLRPIASGSSYVRPPALRSDPPSLEESQERWQRRLLLVPVSLRQALQQTYQGISPALALQLADQGLEPAEELLARPVGALTQEQWSHLWARWQRWLQDLEQERFGWDVDDSSCGSGGSGRYRCWGTACCGPVNAPLAAYYRQRLGQEELQRRRASLELKLLAAREREERQRQQQQDLLDQVDGGDDLSRQADALLCLAAPSRDQVAEAQALYRRARRLRRSVVSITPRLELHQRQLERIDASLAFLALHGPELNPGDARGMDLDDALSQLEALEQESEELLVRGGSEGRRSGRRSPPRSAAASTPSPLELLTPGGLRVQVGRNHRQNEWISLRQARRGDLWFHAQECPGSHVMLKSSAAEAADADLQLAADLAAHFSRARHNGRVPVLKVPCDQLQRIAGAAAGTVTHRGGEVVWASPQRAAHWLAEAESVPKVPAEPGP
ncbi:NFACT family protein [Synechococcus sp. BA-124 BA4]|uniref:Rqc2 family fibronectin-binding protein n=1 Tax=unclassified Synechococcus TaxID=2626047 RepID=UPI001E6063A6|nr:MULTISPECIES: NFACT family protein [unclassified Synechococcus]MEA5398873.1 NFACT family protein [Synechococcus sp. BA-124 BA4]CAK6693901.1 Rqc2 RqcH [Synechococcus sp. CBW1107]